MGETERNVGGLDRLARATIAVALLAAAVRANRRGRPVAAELATLAASSFVFNTITGFCALNRLLGVDTTSETGRRFTGSESSRDDTPRVAFGPSRD